MYGRLSLPGEEGMARDKWSSLVWLGIGLLICVGSLELSLGTFHHPGPGFLSFFAGLIVGVLALVVHLQSRRAPEGDKRVSPLWPRSPWPSGSRNISP